VSPVPVIVNVPVTGGLVITYSAGQVPEISRLAASVLTVDVSFSASGQPVDHQPYLTGSSTAGSISGDVNIARLFARSSAAGAALLAQNDPWLSAQVDQWLDYYTVIRSTTDYSTVIPILAAHLVRVTSE
jgi:hypothetical protein